MTCNDRRHRKIFQAFVGLILVSLTGTIAFVAILVPMELCGHTHYRYQGRISECRAKEIGSTVTCEGSVMLDYNPGVNLDFTGARSIRLTFDVVQSCGHPLLAVNQGCPLTRFNRPSKDYFDAEWVVDLRDFCTVTGIWLYGWGLIGLTFLVMTIVALIASWSRRRDESRIPVVRVDASQSEASWVDN